MKYSGGINPDCATRDGRGEAGSRRGRIRAGKREEGRGEEGLLERPRGRFENLVS